MYIWDLMILWWSIQQRKKKPELRCCEEWELHINLNACTAAINCQKYTWQCVMPLRWEKMNFICEWLELSSIVLGVDTFFSSFSSTLSIRSLFCKLFCNYYTALLHTYLWSLYSPQWRCNGWKKINDFLMRCNSYKQLSWKKNNLEQLQFFFHIRLKMISIY